MKFLQLNLNHCQAAQDLLSQIICETRVDAVIVCEQYKNLSNSVWVKDSKGKAAVWACGNRAIEEVSDHIEDGFIRAKIGGIHIYSCYAPPSATIEEFELFLDRLVKDSDHYNPKIIAGDFNAWAIEWGSRKTNARGQILLEAFSGRDLVLANTGNKPTFTASGRSSVVDLKFMSSSLIREVDWEVNDQYTHSDHQAIIFSTNGPGRSKKRDESRVKYKGWAAKKLDRERFSQSFINGPQPDGTANEMAEQIESRLQRACDAGMPRRRLKENRPSNYWWNAEIGNLRAICLKARRKTQRLTGRPGYEEANQKFQRARHEFQHAILRSKKKNSFKQICIEADSDPWGKAYKVVTSRLKGKKTPQPTNTVLMEKIVTTLFPKHSTNDYAAEEGPNPVETDTIPLATEEELIRIVEEIGENKAPGPDGIPNNALKLAIKTETNTFVNIFNKCLKEGVFPNIWKKQTLVLIPKPNKSPNDPTAYRPICLLDTIGKILEKIIYKRLLPVVEAREGLSSRQYGFRKAKSTIDAIHTVIQTAQTAIGGRGANKKYCAIITLDVKNAFNSANWDRIIQRLQRIHLPEYLIQMIKNYFTNRELCYYTEDGYKSYKVTAGVPQGSVLGPLLWNLMYNDVLTLNIPEEANIIGFADDIAITVSARFIDEVELIANETVKKVTTWMKHAGLEVAEQKTEIVLVTSRRKRENMSLFVGEHKVTSKTHLKYLGCMIDARLNFKAHIDYAANKATNVRAALARMMPNVGGPRQDKRKIITSTVSSVILYAATIWSDALTVKTTAKKIESVYRLSALRVCCSYRTSSNDAVLVIAGMIPIDILANEAKRLDGRRRNAERSSKLVRKIERAESIRVWQKRWEETRKGRWTFKLIPKIETWIDRKHGEVNYHITQFLSGHGGYRSYLHKFGLDDSPECPSCPNQAEDAEHVMFQCPRFSEDRLRMQRVVGRQLSADNIVEVMLHKKEYWEEASKTIRAIHEKLRAEEKIRRASNTRQIA